MVRYRKFYINIDSQCNCSCVNCLLPTSHRQFSTIDTVQVENYLCEVIKNNPNNKRTICEISGGEPTLAENFFDVLRVVNKYKQSGDIYKIVVLTNGITAAEESFAKEMSQYIDDAVICLYSHDAETHDWFTRVKGSFDKKCLGIDNLIKYGVYVHVKTLVMKPTYQQFPQLAKFMMEKWGNKIHPTINGTHYTGDALKNATDLAVRYSDAKRFIEDALDIFLQAGAVTSVFLPLCLLDPMYWHLAADDYLDEINDSYSVAPNMSFGKAGRLLDEFLNVHSYCKSCRISKRCNWPWRRYEELFGFNEIFEAYSNLKFN